MNCSAASLPGHNSDAANVYSRSIDFPHGTGESQLRSVLRPLALLIALLPLALASATPQARAQERPPRRLAIPCAAPSSMQSPASPSPALSFLSPRTRPCSPTATANSLSTTSQRAAIRSLSPSPAIRGAAASWCAASVSPHLTPASRRNRRSRFRSGPTCPAWLSPSRRWPTIAGHVTLSTADPADGIRIQAFVRRIENGHPHWTIAGEARTRSDGSFRIANLEPGSYRISTSASLDRPGLALNARGPVWGYPSLYYPGTTDDQRRGHPYRGCGPAG